jgi:hypothetical protein
MRLMGENMHVHHRQDSNEFRKSKVLSYGIKVDLRPLFTSEFLA